MLHSTRTKRELFCGGALLGGIVFLLVYTAAPLVFTNDAWLRTGFVEKDIIQHYTGWLFYRESALTFPLGFTESINYPFGNTVTFTDSIPLFAIFFRLIEGILPETFQYFGLFVFLCFMLQGGAAALLLSLFHKSKWFILRGAALFSCSPILLERAFRHTALSSHFLILFALYLYFKNQKEGFHFRVGYLVLLGFAVTIHPYFIPMLFGILFADLVAHVLRTRQWRGAVLFLLAAFAVVLGIGACIGIFSVPASGDTLAGYGYFPMNLNALWTPTSAGGVDWSLLLPTQNQALGSYEGFNYLGLGVLIALPLCVGAHVYTCAKQRVCPLCIVRRHIALAFVCTCLTLFALSTTWTANSTVLFSLSLPDTLQSLCDIFRASGRMFWPVYYLLFLWVVNTIARVPKRRLALWLLGGVLLIQVVDMAPALIEKHNFFTEEVIAFEDTLQDETWDAIAAYYDHIFSLDEVLTDATSIALYAATNGMTTNDGWTARFDSKTHAAEVAAETERLLSGEFAPDTIYLTSNEETFIPLAEALGDAVWAVKIDTLWYALIPKNEAVTMPTASETLYFYPDIPLFLPTYNDDNWTNAIFNTDPTLICFYDNAFTSALLNDASYLVCEGVAYEILNKDYKDAGWVMLTLDIEDARILIDKPLTTY